MNPKPPCFGPTGEHFWSVPNYFYEQECLWCSERRTLNVVEAKQYTAAMKRAAERLPREDLIC